MKQQIKGDKMKKVLTRNRIAFSIVAVIVIILASTAISAKDKTVKQNVGTFLKTEDLVIQARGVDKKIGNVQLVIPSGSLDIYCDSRGTDNLDIQVGVKQYKKGKVEIQLKPDGVFFDKRNPAKLKLFGAYALSNMESAWLTSESGEAVEYGSRNTGLKYTEFDIYHFSSYAYDQYDYGY